MPTTTSYSAATRPTQSVVTFMGMTVIVSIIGAEVGVARGTLAGGNFISKPVEIIIGGTVATIVLSLIAKAGEPGQQFAVGLALVTFISALLVYGPSLAGVVAG